VTGRVNALGGKWGVGALSHGKHKANEKPVCGVSDGHSGSKVESQPGKEGALCTVGKSREDWV